ncbi:hypothetical protein ABTO42_19785, partial [Acinetobacter baumannii]
HKKEPPTSFQKLKEKLKKERMQSSTIPCPIEKGANDQSDNKRTMVIENEVVKVADTTGEPVDVFDEDDIEDSQETESAVEV